MQVDGLARGVFLLDDDGSVLHVLLFLRLHGTGDALPDIRLDGFQGQVVPMVDLGAGRREDLPGEFRVLLRGGQFLRRGEARKDPRVEFLAVEDARVRHGAGDAGRPVLRVRAEALGGAVGIGELQHAPEGAFLAEEAPATAGRNDLVGPPARGHLHCKDVLPARLFHERVGDVIREGPLGLDEVGEARLQDLLPHQTAVHI